MSCPIPANPSSPPGPSPGADARRQLHPAPVAAALFLGALALYWPALHHAFVNYDDDLYVTGNAVVQQGLTGPALRWILSHPVCGNWHPVTMLSHLVDCTLYGQQPGGHHLTSVCLHALNGLLLFLCLNRLTGALWRSAVVAALFVCHPLHVESVAWVAERKDVLSTAFGLLALYWYASYAAGGPVDKPVGTSGSAPSGWTGCQPVSYWLAFGCFTMALLSKPMLVTLPLLWLLLDYWPLQRFPAIPWRALLQEKIPFFALAAASCAVTLLTQAGAGATKSLEVAPLALRGENAFISCGRYLAKHFWPVDLAVFYPLPAAWPMGWVLLSALVLAAMTGWCWRERRRCPFLLVGWLWFLGALVPVIGLVQVGIQAMADRYTYLPSIGLLVLVVWGASEFTRGWRGQAILLSATTLAAIVLCAAATRHQLAYWRNSETLFRHALAVAPDNHVARNNLGLALLDQNQTEAAIREFSAALQLKSDYLEAHNNLGNALRREGQLDAAIREYREAIRVQPNYAPAYTSLGATLLLQGQTNAAADLFAEALRRQPENADARYNLALLLASQGQGSDAIGQLRELLRVQPDDAQSHYKLGNLLTKAGQIEEAISHYQAAIRVQPEFPEARNNLGNLLVKQGQADEAAAQFQEALRQRPDYADAHYNLGHAWLKQGRLKEAASEFQTVVRLSPSYVPARYYLGLVLSRTGPATAAIEQFQAALQLKPEDPALHDKLGIVLGGEGRLDEAIREFQVALRLKPDYAEASTNLARAQALQGAPGAAR